MTFLKLVRLHEPMACAIFKTFKTSLVPINHKNALAFMQFSIHIEPCNEILQEFCLENCVISFQNPTEAL